VILHKREYVFPWGRYIYAAGGNDKVLIAFASHEVVISGYGLDHLLADLAAYRSSASANPARRTTSALPMNPNRRAPSSSWWCEKSRSNAVTWRSSRHSARQLNASVPATSSRLPVSLPASGAGAGQQLRPPAEAPRRARGCPAFRVSGGAASQGAGTSPPAAKVFGRAKSALPNKVLAKTPSLSLRLRFRGFRHSPPDYTGHRRISTGHRAVSSALVRLPSRYRPPLVRPCPALSGPLFTHHTADSFVIFEN
jgi:hypothetical protein